VIKCIQDSFYKIAADALLVVQQLAKVLRTASDSQSHRNAIFSATLTRLKQTDIDQEVKERAIVCTAKLICNLGDSIRSEVQACWPILIERLRNEITRLTTVKALHTIAEAPCRVDLQLTFPEALPLIASFLRKNHRTLKLASVNTLLALYKNYSSFMAVEELKSVVIVELPALLSENDLHVSYVALRLCTLICKEHGPGLVAPVVLGQVLLLVKSPLLQGLALEASIEFFTAVLSRDEPGLGFRDLVGMLTKPIRDHSLVQAGRAGSAAENQQSLAVHKQAFYSISKIIAALTVNSQKEGQLVIQQFISDIKVRSRRHLNLSDFRKFSELFIHLKIMISFAVRNIIN